MTPTWNRGPMSTSKPRSANPVAMTLAPLSWPSCPIFATSSRGFLPSWFLNSATLTLKEKKNKKKNLMLLDQSSDKHVHDGCWMLYTYCGSWRSLHAPRTRCGKRRSPSWCWPCVRQTPSSWRQLFRQPNIWKPKKKEAENTLLSTFSLYSYLKWGIHVIHFHFTFNKLNAIFLAIS